MSERINEIRERLNAATTGPWKLEYLDEGIAEVATPDGGHVAIADGRRADAELIANAPADLAYLLAELDKARETNARLNRRCTKAEAFIGKSIEEMRAKGPVTFGRALANMAAEMEHQRADEAEAKLAVVLDMAQRKCDVYDILDYLTEHKEAP